MEDNHSETKQERREKKLKKQKERIQQHGKELANIYKDAVLKKLGRSKGVDK